MSVTAFTRAVAADARSGLPLGAYASADALHYVFLHADGPRVLSWPRADGVAHPSLATEFPLFAWDEREMAQERGVRFADAPDPRSLRFEAGRFPAAIAASGTGLTQIVVGPVHAGIIEPGRFTFSSGGETVVHLDAQLGYAHRGVERALEGRDALDAAGAVARICGSCSAARSSAYARALEELAGVALGDDVQLARLVLCELERVYNHVHDLAACASGAGWVPGFVQGMGVKEQAMRACALASGHRLLFDAIVPGGVGGAVLLDRPALVAALDALQNSLERYLAKLFANSSLVSRWRRAGVVTHQTAVDFGAVGPAHRASKGLVDIRTAAPYGAYAHLIVRAAEAAHGDVLARVSVKRDELGESLRLIREALALLGRAPRPPSPPLRVGAGVSMACSEGPRGAETVAVHVGERGELRRIHVISASYRNWPVVARAMDGNIVPDFPLVNKSFNLCYACADR